MDHFYLLTGEKFRATNPLPEYTFAIHMKFPSGLFLLPMIFAASPTDGKTDSVTIYFPLFTAEETHTLQNLRAFPLKHNVLRVFLSGPVIYKRTHPPCEYHWGFKQYSPRDVSSEVQE
ncbi:hypothetical protein BaRGS_00018144 [Batillaria attramentaria]|uniref:Uncharacterized protein n=1 Tax=Batillaria attramentaria TaxID=370345 RepID=A0ABD0KTD6_9CAEN